MRNAKDMEFHDMALTVLHGDSQQCRQNSTAVDANASGTELDRIRVWYAREASAGRKLLDDIDEIIINFGAGLGPQPSDADGIALQVAGNGGVGVTYGEGRHFLISGSGSDTIVGGGDIDIVITGAGTDNVQGKGGADWIATGDWDDVIDGGEGNDVLNGGKGSDVVRGGSEKDRLIANLDSMPDELYGDDDIDTIVYKYSQGNSTIKVTGEVNRIGNKVPQDFGLAVNDNGMSGSKECAA